MKNKETKQSSNIVSYTIGFVLSAILTITAFALVNNHINSAQTSNNLIILSIMILAVAQLFVQLVLFLHLGDESKPRLNLMSFTFMLSVVGIIVIGSLWIMNHLDYHHYMSPEDVKTHMDKERDKGF